MKTQIRTHEQNEAQARHELNRAFEKLAALREARHMREKQAKAGHLVSTYQKAV